MTADLPTELTEKSDVFPELPCGDAKSAAPERDLSLLMLDAAHIGESLSRSGYPAYWMLSCGQGASHFAAEIRRAHKRLCDVVAAINVAEGR